MYIYGFTINRDWKCWSEGNVTFFENAFSLYSVAVTEYRITRTQFSIQWKEKGIGTFSNWGAMESKKK